MENFKHEDTQFWQGRTKQQTQESYRMSEWSLLAMIILLIIAAAVGQ